MNPATIPDRVTVNLNAFELEVMAHIVEQLGQPMPAADQARVDEAIRLHQLGLTV